tara:strand:+ start:159 stop:494 length:336 start_codon:yes stop_codon:yes gene_type:complete
MYKERYLLFTSKKGSYKTTDNVYDPLVWSNTDAVLWPVSTFKGIRPGSVNTLDLWFEGGNRVTLNVKNGSHVKIMSIIGNTISSSSQSVITVADVLGQVYIHKDIYDCTIY